MTQLTEDDYKKAYQAYKNSNQPEKAKEVARQFQAFQQQPQQQQQQPPTQDLTNQPVDYDFGKSVENFMPSLMAAGGDLAHAVMNPIDTATAVGNLALSGGANLAQEFVDLTGSDYQVPNQEAGEAFAGMLDERYGSMDALKTTAMNDPAGLLMDLSSVFTGGGSAVAKVGGQATKVGNAINKAGNVIDPLTGVVKAPTAVVEGVLGEPISHKLYGSAFKPTTGLKPEVREQLIQDGIDLRAKPTLRSTKKIEKERKKVQKKREKVLDEAAELGRLVDESELYVNIDDVRAQYAPPRPSSTYAPQIIDDVVDEVSQGIFNNGGRKLTIEEINDIKMDLDETINYKKSNRSGESNANRGDIDEKARKAIANAARQIIYKHAPDLDPLNQQYGKIRNVQNNLQHQGTSRNQNADPLGLFQTTAAAVNPVAGVLSVANRPVPKTTLGIYASDVGKTLRTSNKYNQFRNASMAGRYEQAVLADEEEREREKLAKELRRKDN